MHRDAYDALIEREDYQGYVRPMLAQVPPLESARVVEFGAGSGRLTRLLAPLVQRIRAYDASTHMLSVAELHLLGLLDIRGVDGVPVRAWVGPR